jgi:SAM-dependent methyltransferase
MRHNFLASLHCPYTGSAFKLTDVVQADDTHIHWGLVSSEAGTFPIVDGILRLQVDEFWNPIVDAIRVGQRHRALLLAFDEVPFHGKKGAVINLMSRLSYKAGFPRMAEAAALLKRSFVRRYMDRELSFMQLARYLNPGVLADWQLYRLTMPTFLATYPLVHVVKSDNPILDFSCGVGQASFLISRMYPHARIVCADYSFSSLYLARKYFVPKGDFICLDGDYPLPFSTNYFATVLSSDALHCIDSKLSLAREFVRVLAKTGIIVMPHLHNRLSSIHYARSLTPEGYAALFASMPVRILPEEALIQNYFFHGHVDLGNEWSASDLHRAEQGLSIIVSQNEEPFRFYKGVFEKHIDSIEEPIINPIYKVEHATQGWSLIKAADESFARSFDANGYVCLPHEMTIDIELLNTESLRQLKHTNRELFIDLVRRLIVIDVPKQYGGGNTEPWL